MTGTLQVCDGCDKLKKSRAVRKNTYTRAPNPGETIFVDMIIKDKFLHKFVPNNQKIICVGLLTIGLYLMCA